MRGRHVRAARKCGMGGRGKGALQPAPSLLYSPPCGISRTPARSATFFPSPIVQRTCTASSTTSPTTQPGSRHRARNARKSPSSERSCGAAAKRGLRQCSSEGSRLEVRAHLPREAGREVLGRQRREDAKRVREDLLLPACVRGAGDAQHVPDLQGQARQRNSCPPIGKGALAARRTSGGHMPAHAWAYSTGSSGMATTSEARGGSSLSSPSSPVASTSSRTLLVLPPPVAAAAAASPCSSRMARRTACAKACSSSAAASVHASACTAFVCCARPRSACQWEGRMGGGVGGGGGAQAWQGQGRGLLQPRPP